MSDFSLDQLMAGLVSGSKAAAHAAVDKVVGVVGSYADAYTKGNAAVVLAPASLPISPVVRPGTAGTYAGSTPGLYPTGNPYQSGVRGAALEAEARPPLPVWVLPVALGAGALALVIILKKKG